MVTIDVLPAVVDPEPDPDVTAPVVVLEFDPVTGDGTVTATDVDEVLHADVYHDGVLIAAGSGPVPFRFSIDVKNIASGTHELRATVTDTAGNTGTAAHLFQVQGIPDPVAVDCVLSEPVETVGPWGLCRSDGTQVRTITRTRSIVTPPANGGAACGPLTETEIESRDCEYVPPDPGNHPYFAQLLARPDLFVAHGLRTQEEIDAIEKGGGNDLPGTLRYPTYEPEHDAMVQRTKNGGNAVQKQPRLGIKQTAMLLTYDFKIGPGAAYLGVGYLKQYKAYRIDQGTNVGLWLSTKLKFTNTVDVLSGEPCIAELLTTGGEFIGPGTTNANSEILAPRVGRFWPKVNTWSRYWVLVEGKLGGNPWNENPKRPDVSSEVVFVSIWAADEHTEPRQLYDRLQMYSPVQDIRQFRFEFNTSESNLLNPVAEFWDRNFVVLTGDHLTQDVARELLQKPVR
jgi:hypothetical protein